VLKLYFGAGGCSIASHIALREAGLSFELHAVDFARGKRLEDGRPFTDVSEKNYIPALILDDGQLLTEGCAILQYIADLAPASGLAPAPASFERVRLQEWLNFIATELHKGMWPMHQKATGAELEQLVRDRLAARLAYVARQLGDRTYLTGDAFTIADAYLFYVLRTWQRTHKGALDAPLRAYYLRLADRPSVRAALNAEGITA
jgi:glutathione S-transferase